MSNTLSRSPISPAARSTTSKSAAWPSPAAGPSTNTAWPPSREKPPPPVPADPRGSRSPRGARPRSTSSRNCARICGEIEAAAARALPPLITLENLRGTFHNHTTASDGRATLEEMAAAARDLGLEYLGIADHSKSSFQAHGLDAKRLLEQREEILRLNTDQ